MRTIIKKINLNLSQIQLLLRLKSFDNSTEEGRSMERYRLILLSSFSAMAAKIFSVVCSLISIPLCLNYLGFERFGLWMTISSIVAMLSFADFGIGNGLLNLVAAANGRADFFRIRRYVSSALAALSFIAILVLSIFLVISYFVEWGVFFNIKSPLAVHESSIVMTVLIITFALNIPIGVVQRTQMGIQKSYIADLWQLTASILSLLATVVAIKLNMGLPWLVTAVSGAPILTSLFNGIIFFGFFSRNISPNISFISKVAVKKILHSGSLFFILQLAGLVAFQSDILVISHYLGPELVANYTVLMKYFSIPTLVMSFYLMALWPAYGEAFSRKDVNWIKKIYKKSMITSLTVNIPLTIVLIIFCGKLMLLWVGPELKMSNDLIIGMGIWSIVTIAGGNYAALLNGLNVLRFQVIFACLMALVNIVLSIWLVKILGISGVVYGSIISSLLFNYIPLHFHIRNLLSKIDE